MMNLKKVSVALCTLLILILLLILHFRKHFSVRFCGIFRCKSCIKAQHETVYFLPMAFLLYIVYEIILCIIIICRTSLLISNETCLIIDDILIYSVILLPVWESSFNFYRFYSTYYASKKVTLLSNQKISIKFMYFGASFIAIFLLQIHIPICYYLFPIIMAYHFFFNILCAWLFAHILIVQYRVVMCNSSYLTDIHDDMLQSVFFMRKISIIASINSSIFVGLILMHHDSTIMLYAPFLWNISTICLALNFVHNRHFFKNHYLSYYKTYLNCQIRLNCHKSINICKSSQQKMTNKTPSNATPPPVPLVLPNINSKTPLSAHTNGTHQTHVTIVEDECDTPALILTLQMGAASTPRSTDRDPSISSNDKPKLWYHRGLVAIGTPKSQTTCTQTNTTTTPNTRLLDQQTLSESPANRDRNNSNKAMKVLGIPIFEEQRDLRPPHTPIPGFLDHLYAQPNPNTLPVSLPVIHSGDPNQLIRVSSHSQLTIRPIAIAVDINQNNNQNQNNIKFTNDENEINLNKESTPWYFKPTFFRAEEDTKRQKKGKDKNSLSLLKKKLKRIGKINKETIENSKNIQNIQNINFATENINESDRQRARTLSTKNKNKNKNKNVNNHIKARSANLNGLNGLNALTTPKTPDIHVLESFKLLAKHGLYSDANIASAEQLRNYTMKQ